MGWPPLKPLVNWVPPVHVVPLDALASISRVVVVGSTTMEFLLLEKFLLSVTIAAVTGCAFSGTAAYSPVVFRENASLGMMTSSSDSSAVAFSSEKYLPQMVHSYYIRKNELIKKLLWQWLEETSKTRK